MQAAFGSQTNEPPSVDGLKRKTEGDDDADNGPMESDILFDVAIMEALECAGYTIPPGVEGFKSPFPVSASFP